MQITTEQVKELRDKTGISVMQCKKALEEAGGDMEKAVILLSKQSKQIAEKKSGRNLGSGIVKSYIHTGGSAGSMIELLCETDFVAKNEDFQALAYDIAMQITATAPLFLKKEEISEEARAKAIEVFQTEVADKPEEMQAKILEGKLDAHFKSKILLEQEFIKDPSKTIATLIQEGTQKFGEKIEIGNFVRFSI
ncbi:MAG: elongation factor Ts [Candidatus Pacebacteria bacterium]|nr:elongation factor Ts [Candidatus Paceibacterota bacterium]